MTRKGYVLMLEDDPDDRFITKETLEKLGYDISIDFVHYSHDLYNHLESFTKPDVILLDFDSIPESATNILQKLKSDIRYKPIPVVVLGDNCPVKFVAECYELGANSFISKPSTMDDTLSKIDVFFKYWFAIAEVPS